jgi:hypothetical protein
MPCGCQNTCGCNIVAGAGISVAVLPGGTFQIASTVGAVGVPTFVQETPPVFVGPYIWYELDGLGNLVTVWVENGI